MKLVLTKEELSAVLLTNYPAQAGYVIADVTIKPYSGDDFCTVPMIPAPTADVVSISGDAA